MAHLLQVSFTVNMASCQRLRIIPLAIIAGSMLHPMTSVCSQCWCSGLSFSFVFEQTCKGFVQNKLSVALRLHHQGHVHKVNATAVTSRGTHLQAKLRVQVDRKQAPNDTAHFDGVIVEGD
jgi:hypothetical protein